MSDSPKNPQMGDQQFRDHLGCEASERWLHELYAGKGVPATLPVRLLQHVEECGACRAEYESLARFRADVPLLIPDHFVDEEPDDDPLFVNAVMAKVRELPSPVRRREWVLRGRIAALVTISLLVGLLLALQVLNHETRGDGEGSLEHETRVAAGGVTPDAGSSPASDSPGVGVPAGEFGVAGEGGALFDPEQVMFQPQPMEAEELREWMPNDGQLVRHIPERKATDPDPEDGWMF